MKAVNGISRERLSAYLDGEIDADERIRIERALADSPALRAELEEMRAADDALRHAMEAVFADRPVPDALRAMLAPEATMEMERGDAREAGGERRTGFRRRPDTRRPGTSLLAVVRRWFGPLLTADGVTGMARPALAAATLLAVGIALGLLLSSGFDETTGAGRTGAPVRLTIEAGDGFPLLASALERVPSGTRHRLDAAGRAWVEPVMTFRTADGEWCREFRFVTDGRKGSDDGEAALRVGIACRAKAAQDASWRLVALAPVENAATVLRKSPPPGTFRPAADPALPASLGGLLTKMIAAAPLDPARERALIAGGWRSEGEGEREGVQE